MAKFLNASFYGTPYVEIKPSMVETITQENTDPVSCTLRLVCKTGHYRVYGDVDQVCEILGRNKEEFVQKGI